MTAEEIKVGDTIDFEDGGVGTILRIEGGQAFLQFREGDLLQSCWCPLGWLVENISSPDSARP